MRLTHYDEHKKRWQINNDHGAVMIDELNYAVGEAVDKLAAYEDAEEQGLLVRLPCKVGTLVWSSVLCRIGEDLEEYPTQWPFTFSMMDEWGKGFFLTREEAEAALKNSIEKENKNVWTYQQEENCKNRA